MKTLADLKRRCKPGTVIEFSRLNYKPATDLVVVAERKEKELGLATAGRRDLGYISWARARDWQFTDDTATQLSHGDNHVPLLRLRFLSEAALKALPSDVEALRQRYQPEPTTADLTPVFLKTGTVIVAAVTVETDDTTTEAAPLTLTEEAFWNAQTGYHELLLELAESAVVRAAALRVPEIRCDAFPQVSLRDVRIASNGDWTATLVVAQVHEAWYFNLTGALCQRRPDCLTRESPPDDVRRFMNPTTYSVPLRALLNGIQALPTTELQVAALLLLSGHTVEWLQRTTQQSTFVGLTEWLEDREIQVEPQRVQTADGYILSRQPDGSYRDGDLTYGSLEDLTEQHDWEEIGGEGKLGDVTEQP